MKTLPVVYKIEAIPDTLATRISEKQSIEIAVNNVKRYLRSEAAGTVFWPDNKRLWAENLQVSM